MNILDFQTKKNAGQKISMVTCYDHWSAQIINESEIDSILVGDSLSMVMHGHPSTLQADMDMMVLHTLAVVKGAPKKFIVGDLPFMSYRKDIAKNSENAARLMRAGAHALKLEGAAGNLELISHLVESGIPIMGHLGLTPQSVNMLGGFRVQGKDSKDQELILENALALEKAGCFGIVLECVPATLAAKVSKSVRIPTIGIGAGAECDGQVLVLQDMLGMNNKFTPKFLKKYLNGFDLVQGALNQYHRDVIGQEFPTDKESY